MNEERASGILLPIPALPGPYGIGSLGREARDFVDFLQRAGQKYWQILPLGPTGYGNSPYQTDSAFAGNPYLIDLAELTADGLLLPGEAESKYWGADPECVDYGALYAGRPGLMELACRRGWDRDRESVAAFRRENTWVEEYARFRALKAHFGGKPWLEWPEKAARLHDPAALAEYTDRLQPEIRTQIYTQFLFFRQWNALRDYARERGVGIIGDVPIYVPLDSADVWAEREWFCLDEEGRPTEVAGVPPDYFSADGQLWGNPLYDWDKLAADGFDWWIRRLRAAAGLYDKIRIDHFRGLASFWAVPSGAETARNGRWCPGPGIPFVDAVKAALPGTAILAEDLGILTEDVFRLLAYAGWPGMKVLEFAFDAGHLSSYLPHRYEKNCVCYTGTHDNPPLRQWEEEVPPQDAAFAREYLGLGEEARLGRAVIRAGMASAARLFVAPMQDWLDLGAAGRINTPGTIGPENWRWRMRPEAMSSELADTIARMTHIYGRK